MSILKRSRRAANPDPLFRAWLSLAMMLVMAPVAARGQEAPEPSGSWYVSAGLGYHSFMPRHGLAGSLETAYQDGISWYSARFFSAAEFFPLGGNHGPDLTQESVTGLAAYYGRCYEFTLSRPLFPLFPIPLLARRETSYRIVVAAGVSVQRSILRDGPIDVVIIEYTTQEVRRGRSRYVIGLPLRIELTQQFTPSISYVHRLEGNLNGARHFWGITWALQFGW